MRLLSANVRHFKREGSSAEWVPGDKKGVVMSCSDELTHQLHTVNAKTNNIEVLPHSRHVDAEQICFSATFTRAEVSSSFHQKWKDLVDSSQLFKTLLDEKSEDLRGLKTRFVSEVDIKLGPLDFVLSHQTLVPFCKMATQLASINLPKGSEGHRLYFCAHTIFCQKGKCSLFD